MHIFINHHFPFYSSNLPLKQRFVLYAMDVILKTTISNVMSDTCKLYRYALNTLDSQSSSEKCDS